MKIKFILILICSVIFNTGCGDIENSDPRKMSERSAQNTQKVDSQSRVKLKGKAILESTIVGGDDNEDDDGGTRMVPFNHGDHNDPPWKLEQERSFGCGNLSLSSCSSKAHVERITAQACRDIVSDDTDLGLPINKGYKHGISSNNGIVLKAEYINNGQGSFSYLMNIKYTCNGYSHPAPFVVCPAPPLPC